MMIRHLQTCFRSTLDLASKQGASVPGLAIEQSMISGELLLKHFQACQNLTFLVQLHSLTVKTGLTGDTLFASKLIDLYSKFAHLQTTRKLFDETPHRTEITWNLILKSYCKEKQYKESLFLFSHLFSSGKPNNYSISIALKACCGLKALDFGKTIQGFVTKSVGLGKELFIGSALVELYSKCGRMESALRVFEEYPDPDTVLWTTVVSGYVENGEARQALEFFAGTVIAKGFVIDAISLISVVSSCTQILNLKAGRSVHGYMIRVGFNCELPLSNALLSFYGKTGCVNATGKLFTKMEAKDVISWGSVISCYAHHGKAGEALDLFDKMVSKGIEPNVVVIISALQACEAIGILETGKIIHEIATRKGLDSDIMISTTLIDMYMNCCSPEEAINVFENMRVKDYVCYSSLLHGCVQNGMFHKSIEVLRDMLVNNIRPCTFDMVKVLTVCSELGVLRQTSCSHGFIVKVGLDKNSFIGASLIESYAKCGNLDDSIAVFDGIKDRDVVIWSSMLAGYGYHGKGREALELFEEMTKNSSVRPNDVSFVSILSACSHAGLVQEGMDMFNKMVIGDYKQIPNSKHYGIVVDLLGRIGELDKAMDFIGRMPEPVGAHVWGALVGACRIYQNREVGEFAAKKLIQLDHSQTGHHILLSNLYAGDENWDNAAEVRKLVKEKQMKKVSGQSVIELRDEVCSFIANDRSHRDFEQIYDLLTKLQGKMKEEVSVCSELCFA